ncbi:MAG: hypothetical protein ABR559_06270, partial [Gemmatimonadota bacterium]
VTWTTTESGLVFASSIKSINFRDTKSNNFQKNLTNRRGDMLFEAVTLHRRFPYSVLTGFLFLDHGAETDNTGQRRSTFLNAHARLRLFSGRNDPADRDEQYERLFIVLVDANPETPTFRITSVGKPEADLELGVIFDDVVELVAARNPDFYEVLEGRLRKV